jgi:hypothetical protein
MCTGIRSENSDPEIRLGMTQFANDKESTSESDNEDC